MSKNPFDLTDRSINSMLKAYQDFGYNTLTREDVLAALKKLENREDVSGNIIAMFLKRELTEAGLLPKDDKDSPAAFYKRLKEKEDKEK